MKEAKEYFTKLKCDTDSKEDLCAEIWEKMDADKREPYFRDLKDLEKDKD